uniref:Uncharacterized protein n=1 Tax=Zea mays TaxID=4577 RepID=C0PK02_MAIZE|nr:unknown [Zea mays]
MSCSDTIRHYRLSRVLFTRQKQANPAQQPSYLPTRLLRQIFGAKFKSWLGTGGSKHTHTPRGKQ